MVNEELKRQLDLMESVLANDTKKVSEIIRNDDSILCQFRLTPLDIAKSKEMKQVIKEAGGKTMEELDKEEENRVKAESYLIDEAIENDRQQEAEHLGDDFDEER